MRHIILISGKDSLATAIVQRDAEPSHDYEYVFNEDRRRPDRAMLSAFRADPGPGHHPMDHQ
jgi:hypothetical protein